jgi:hypothetical protein
MSPIKESEIEERIANMIEWTTENQGLIKDGWKILKVYKTISGSYTKYALIECIHCGNKKLVIYYNFMKKDPVPCTSCGGKWIDWAESMVGTIVGHYKILEYKRLIKRESNKKVDIFFKVQCIHCGKIREEELYSNSGWNRYSTCPECPRMELTYYERRFKEYQQSAKKRNIIWNLSLQEFINIATQKCYYCGEEPIYQSRIIGNKTETGDIINGIDRIDSSKGYTIDNCVPCCTHCNIMKMQYSIDSFLSKVAQIYNYQIIKQGSTTIENTTDEVGSE